MEPSISVCMIVKNEEKVIDRCLSSIAHLVYEVIVVDTGSTDNTKQLVQKYTSKIYDFEWINDFSAARNYAASKATGEWIVVLDADEYIDETNFKQFIDELIIDTDKVDSYSARIINFTGINGERLLQNYHDRVYKNNGNVHYYRKIHEQFQNKNGQPVSNKKANLMIFHSGYLNRTTREKDKHQRNKELLDKEMTNGDINAFDYFNLGNEYFSVGEYSQALDSYLKAYKEKKDIKYSWVSITLVQIINCLISLKKYNEALDIIKDTGVLYPNTPEFLTLKGEIFFLRGQLEEAKNIYLNIINNASNLNQVVLRPDFKEIIPHRRLAEIYLFEENYERSIYHYVSVLNINKYCEESIKKVIYILNKFHKSEEITAFFQSKNLIDNNNITSFVSGCFEVGNPQIIMPFLEQNQENQVLYHVALFKNQCIKNDGNFDQVTPILNFEILSKLSQSHWINIVDLLLYKILSSNKNDILLSHFYKDNNYRILIEMVEGNFTQETIDETLYLYCVQTLIQYKQFSLCEKILKYNDMLGESGLSKLAAILFSNGFKAEALQLYDRGNWSSFEKQDFINIINSLVSTNDVMGVIEFAKYAKVTFPDDYRFYKYILEHSVDNDLFISTLNEVQTIFISI